VTDRPVRLAGHGLRPDGARATWTLAEGRRGRRWREVASRDDVIVLSLLFETDPDGRFAHLEGSSPAGLVTLHPEADGTLHGNVVGRDGVRHVIGLPMPAGGRLTVSSSVVAAAALTWTLEPNGGGELVVLDPGTWDLTVRTVVAGDQVAIDEQGAPRLRDAQVWRLEA
jgi:hypothetical protein